MTFCPCRLQIFDVRVPNKKKTNKLFNRMYSLYVYVCILNTFFSTYKYAIIKSFA